MSSPPLIFRKGLSVRTAIWEALYDVAPSPNGKDMRERLCRVLEDEIQARCPKRDWERVSPNEQRLDKFAAEVGTAFIAGARKHFVDEKEHGRLAERVKARLAGLDCNQCCSGAKLSAAAICSGGVTTDAQALTHGGRCLLDIRQLFKSCLELTIAYYDRFSGRPSDAQWNAELDIQIQADSAPRMFGRYGTRASTRRSATHATVRLDLTFPDLTPACYFGLFPLFMHELFAHAFAHCCNPPGGAAGPASAFEEGWMDYVTWMVIEHLARGVSLGKNFSGMFSHLGAQLAEAEQFHAARHDIRGYLGEGVVERAHGRDLAERFHHLLRGLTTEADEEMLRFSLRLNVMARDWREKDLFISALGIFLPEIGAVIHPDMLRFQKHVKDYLISKDLDLFVDTIKEAVARR